MQTSREVISALLRGSKPERVGLVDYPWVDTIAAWVEQGYPTRMVHKEVGQKRWPILVARRALCVSVPFRHCERRAVHCLSQVTRARA